MAADTDVWLVVAEEILGYTYDPFGEGERILRDAYTEEYALSKDYAEPFYGMDLKTGDWFLTFNGVRQRGFYVRRLEKVSAPV